MRSFVAVLALAVAAAAHSATSYQNNNLKSYGDGGYSSGGYDQSGWDNGKDDGHGHSSYKFEYGVKDSHTGDNKDAWEHSDGHNIKGKFG